MAVKYVSEFSFPKSPSRPDPVRGYARGGSVKGPSTPQCYAKGGATTPFAYKSGGLFNHKGVANDTGHAGKRASVNDDKVQKVNGIGDGNVKFMGTKIGAVKTLAGYAKGGMMKADKGKRNAAGGYAKGGLAKGTGMANDTGHNGPNAKVADYQVDRKGGIGDGGLKYGAVPDKKSPAATRTEKSSGVQSPAFRKGGVMKKASGGMVATGAVKMGEKAAWNKDDAVSPGSPKRTPPAQSMKNKDAANSKFSREGRMTDPATKQAGDVQRMSGFSDFKSGGSSKPAFNRLKNLGHYAHGGKVLAAKYEAKAGTPKTAAGSMGEKSSGMVAKKAMGGLSRGTSPKKNAAIHAKGKKPSSAGALTALAGALGGMGAPKQGMGAPPGMAGGMGAPPGGPMGGMQPPPGMGAPQMARGGRAGR